MRVILQIWCQIQGTSSSLRYVNCGPGHIQNTYSSAYLGFNIQLKVAPLLLEVSRKFNARYTANLVPNTAHNPSLRYVNCGPGHIQYTYSSAYSDFNIRLNVSALLLYISRQFNARYTAFLVLNTEHIAQFTLCELWSRPYTKCLQLRIFMPQYSAVGTCAANVDITTVQCALYCKL
jgi:hypothetical protein